MPTTYRTLCGGKMKSFATKKGAVSYGKKKAPSCRGKVATIQKFKTTRKGFRLKTIGVVR